jgi:hypothetical protein
MVRRLGGEDGVVKRNERPPAVLAEAGRARSAGGSKVQTSGRRSGSP